MLFVWNCCAEFNVDYKDYEKTFLICASKDGEFCINERIRNIEQENQLPVHTFYEIQRNNEPIISYDNGGIKYNDDWNNYKYFYIKYFTSTDKCKRGDIIACLVFTNRRKNVGRGPFPAFKANSFLRPTDDELSDNKVKVLMYLKGKDKEKSDEELDEYARGLRSNREKYEENQALKIRLQIENQAEEEKSRILEERLRKQREAMEEEARLTREILELREKIEKQDADAMANSLDMLEKILKGSTGKK
ncbi:MAG: hypothetical protein ACXWQA_07035 [Pseudobdellovibrionaceae bacterium]